MRRAAVGLELLRQQAAWQLVLATQAMMSLAGSRSAAVFAVAIYHCASHMVHRGLPGTFRLADSNLK